MRFIDENGPRVMMVGVYIHSVMLQNLGTDSLCCVCQRLLIESLDGNDRGERRGCDQQQTEYDDDDDCWCFNMPFSNLLAISAQPPLFFVQSMIRSMGMRTTEPGHLQ